jgi:hypothetical protein
MKLICFQEINKMKFPKKNCHFSTFSKLVPSSTFVHFQNSVLVMEQDKIYIAPTHNKKISQTALKYIFCSQFQFIY